MVQTAAKLVLEPIFEADFEDNAYGYRPARGAADAVKEVHRLHLAGATPMWWTPICPSTSIRFRIDDLLQIGGAARSWTALCCG